MESPYRQGPLQEDEPVILLDRKDREYLARLEPGRPISIRGGKIAASDIIGHDEGTAVRSSVNGLILVALGEGVVGGGTDVLAGRERTHGAVCVVSVSARRL